MLPGPLAMDYGSKVPKHMGVSPGAGTPAINPNSHGAAGIPNPTKSAFQIFILPQCFQLINR